MAKQNEINFYLKDRTAKSENTQRKTPPMAQIWLYYSLGNGAVNRLEYYSGERIDPEKWDTETKWVKAKYRREQMELINRLETLKTTVRGIADKARVLNIPLSPAYFKEQLSTPEIITGTEEQKTIEDIIKIYLKECENHKTKATISNIKVSMQVFRDFVGDSDFRIERGIEKPLQFEFETINREWYNYFLDYCFNVRDFTNNYTGTCIKNLKAFLNWAYEAKYNINDACKMKWFKKLEELGEIIYLTYEELMFMYGAKIQIVSSKVFPSSRPVMGVMEPELLSLII